MKAWFTLLLVGAVLAYGYMDARRRARVDRGPRHHRTDFTVYQVAAEALRDGTDPYEARNPRGYRYVYPPLLAVLLQPVAKMAPPDAAYLFFILSAALLVLALFLLARLKPGGAGQLGWPVVLLASFFCLGFAHQGFQRGQITHALLALQVVALVLAMRGRFTGAGFALGFSAVLRLTPLLPAGALGLGLLAAVRTKGWSPVLRYSAGLGGALVLGVVVIPWASLGSERAQAVTERWVEVTQALYAPSEAGMAALDQDYAINEFRFKNQAPRRVFTTAVGWAKGAEFTRERPALEPPDQALANQVSTGLAFALILLASWVGWRWLREPDSETGVVAFALVVALPVLITRYTWPTHFLMLLPVLACAVFYLRRGLQGEAERASGTGGAQARLARLRVLVARTPWFVWTFFTSTLLFYAAHARVLQVLGEAGCLMVGTAILVACVTGWLCGSRPRASRASLAVDEVHHG